MIIFFNWYLRKGTKSGTKSGAKFPNLNEGFLRAVTKGTVPFGSRVPNGTVPFVILFNLTAIS